MSMNVTPRITVYIASYNYGRFLEEAIESVLRQTIVDWELIIIDDGSDDETQQVISRYIPHPKITAFKAERIGLPAVCNLAIKHAKGKYIIRLDGDDVFDENILLLLSDYLDKDDDLALIFPDYYLVDDNGDIFAHEIRKKLYENDHLMDMPPNGACTMIRTSTLKEIGGYREDLGAQDGMDLWLKIKDNYKSTNINLPLFYYRRHGKNLTEKPLRIINARRELKKDAASKILVGTKPIIAVIPCRRYYDFIENLWDQKLGGKTLLERDIDVCVSSHIIDKVVVLCDNEKAEDTVKQYNNAQVSFIKRNENSTLRSSNIVETLKLVTSKFDPNYEGIILLRYVQAPFISKDTIEEAITSLVISGADSVRAVEELRSSIYKRTAFGLISLSGNSNNMEVSVGESLYRDVSTCVALQNKNIKSGSLTGAKMAGFIVSVAESFFISSAHEMKVARSLLESK